LLCLSRHLIKNNKLLKTYNNILKYIRTQYGKLVKYILISILLIIILLLYINEYYYNTQDILDCVSFLTLLRQSSFTNNNSSTNHPLESQIDKIENLIHEDPIKWARQVLNLSDSISDEEI
jgi:predicted PurR-regulated permease PerM